MSPGAGPGDGAPVAPRRPVERVLHGVRDVDDYAWMRNHDDPDLLANLRAERDWYDTATAHLAPLRAELYRRMADRTPAAEESVSWRRDGYLYRTRTAEGHQYPALYRSSIFVPTSAGGELQRPAEGFWRQTHEDMLLDLEELARGHEYAALGVRLVSPDGNWLAWSLDVTGDEVYRLRFRDLRTGEDAPDEIGRSYYTGAWSADSTCFFYVVHDEVYRPFRVLRHELGTDPSADVEVFRDDDRKYDVEVRTTRSGGFVVIRTANRDTAECHLIPAAAPHTAPVVVWPRRTGIEYDVDHVWPAGQLDGATGPGALLAVTDEGATEFRVLAADLRSDLPSGLPAGLPAGLADLGWRELVPGRDDVRVLRVEPFAGHLVLTARRGGRTLLEVRGHDGALRHALVAPVPEGTLELNPDQEYGGQEYGAAAFTARGQSLIEPPAWWDVDPGPQGAEPRWTVRHRSPVPGYDAADYLTERIEATAEDGTAVPVTVARRRDTPVDGTAPCLLYGYGAYEATSDPEFDVAVSALLDLGVVFAVAHIRGGGENGRRWWLGGRLHTKPTTFSDFVAAGRALVSAGLAAPDRLAIRGLSAGGLLMGASLGLAPRLWRAVVAEVPFVDVVGSMLDPDIPLTVNEWDEWGDPRRPDDFAVMRGYAPYENPPSGPRPDLLVTGALHDPRVLVHEPAKWVARLRATAEPGTGMLLFRPELGEGAHVGPSGRYAHLDYEAEILAWVLDRLGVASGTQTVGGPA